MYFEAELVAGNMFMIDVFPCPSVYLPLLPFIIYRSIHIYSKYKYLLSSLHRYTLQLLLSFVLAHMFYLSFIFCLSMSLLHVALAIYF